MLAPGKLLQGRYRIINKVGGGGTSIVYEATDERLRNNVAVKESLHGYDSTIRKAFRSEASVLSKLRHQLLPKVTDHFEESGRLYLIMDFIPGDHLGELLKQRHAPFDLSQVLVWADQLFDVLEYIHSYQPPILHHDIKPQNLKLLKGDEIILLDFGLVKGALTQLSRTAGVSIFGYTEQYSPLEQIQGKPTDPRSDLFSLAATLYYLMTNVQPPSALDRAMALVSNGADPLQLASQINSQVPPSIGNIFHKAMSLVADQRPASANEMRQALRAANQLAVPSLQVNVPISIHRDKYNIVGWCSAPVRCVALSPDGKYLAGGTNHGLRLWDTATGQLIIDGQVTTFGDGVSAVVFSPDGKYVAASSENKRIKVWDIYNQKDYLYDKLSPDSHYRDIDGTKMKLLEGVEIMFSSIDTNFLLAVYNCHFYTWNFRTGQVSTISLNADTTNAAISPNGKQVAVFDEGIDLHDIQIGKQQNIYRNKIGCHISCIVFSPDGNYIAASGLRHEQGKTDFKGWMGLWELNTRKELLLVECDSNIASIAISPDNKSLATGSSDNKLCIWKLESGNQNILGECGYPIITITYSTDGRHIVTGSVDRTVRIWDII